MADARRGPRAFALAASVVALAVVADLASPATAQDNNLGEFLLRMFGGKPAPQSAAQPPNNLLTHRTRRKAKDFLPSSQTRAPGATGDLAPKPAPGPASLPPPPAVAPTFFVDVIGDSLAGQIVQGLADNLGDRPEIAALNKSHDSSGLVRDDFFDWGKAANDLAAAPGKIDFVVVMVGANDSQPLREGADVLDPLSERWNAQYQARVVALLAPFKAKKIPIAWLGLPPMRSDRLSADIAKLNALDRESVEKEGAVYIDLWDAFASASGGFDAMGPDVTGATVKLRGVDGVHFTKAGADKAASFVAAEIRRAYDKGKPASDVAALPPDIEKAAKDINAQIKQDAAEAPASPLVVERPLAGPIQSLTTRPLAQDGALESKDSRPPAQTEAVLKVLRSGAPPPPVPGRADDFRAQ